MILVLVSPPAPTHPSSEDCYLLEAPGTRILRSFRIRGPKGPLLNHYFITIYKQYATFWFLGFLALVSWDSYDHVLSLLSDIAV